jgi:hypothetical protein
LFFFADARIATWAAQAGGLAEKEDLPSQGRGLAVVGDQAAVACQNQVVLFKGGKQVFSLDIPYEGLSVGMAPSGAEITVGGKDGNAHVYTVDGATLTEKKVLKLKGGGLSAACVNRALMSPSAFPSALALAGKQASSRFPVGFAEGLWNTSRSF